MVQVKRFMPFLEGNRQCIGMSLAKLNYTTAVTLLLSHFSFRLADDVSACHPPSIPPTVALCCDDETLSNLSKGWGSPLL